MTVEFEMSETEQCEKWLDFDLEKFHDSWQDCWGPTIKSKDLRSAIEATPRLSNKLKKQVFQKVESVVLDNRTGDVPFPPDQLNVVSAYLKQTGSGLIRRVGLACHANTIKNHLNGPESHKLLQLLGQDSIRKALVFQDIAPDAQDEYTAEKLDQNIKEDGLACLLAWIKQFPNPIAIRLAVLLPKPKENSHQLDKESTNIAVMVITRLLTTK